MVLPPKGDPRRPLHLAIRLCWILAIFFILFGAFTTATIFFYAKTSKVITLSNSVAIPRAMFHIVPGVIYVVVAINLHGLKKWAVIVGIVLASMQFALACLLVVFAVQTLFMYPQITNLYVSLGGGLAVGVVLASLIFKLLQSFKAIRDAKNFDSRGFAPIMAIPIDLQPSDSDRFPK